MPQEDTPDTVLFRIKMYETRLQSSKLTLEEKQETAKLLELAEKLYQKLLS